MEKKIPTTLNGQAYDIPSEGSLGLLALGHIGVALWRKKRAQMKEVEEENGSQESSGDSRGE